MTWKEDQEYERLWWGDCANTFNEEVKQLTYAFKMGMTAIAMDDARWPCYMMHGKKILDIGGGPVSILLKCEQIGPGTTVADPCNYPDWIRSRYAAHGVEYMKSSGEDLFLKTNSYDEVWIYNVLQHVENPEKIIGNARDIAPVVRIFEWIDIPPCEGHPQELKEDKLNEWLCGKGTVEWVKENNCNGQAYFGVFNY